MNHAIETKLTEKAYEETTPFCYRCYADCPEGECGGCGSDDLMRHLPGVGVEYGTEWTFKYLLDGLKEVDAESAFGEMIEGCYGEIVEIGFLKVGLVRAMKDADPIAWRISRDEYIDGLVEGGVLATVAGKLYRTSDIESRL